jgi:hypothetical protein
MPAAVKRLFIDSGVVSSRPEVDRKVLRFCQVGRLFPFRLDRTGKVSTPVENCAVIAG